MNEEKNPKVYDCFMFFNELELLEIRLAELNEVVDYFLLVEAPFTHSGKSKPLYYEENKERYKKWQQKIIHVVCPIPEKTIFDKFFEFLEIKFPNKIMSRLYIKFSLGRKKIEAFQRNHTLKGLIDAKNEDIIMISDVDEITRADKIQKIKLILKQNPNSIVRLDEKLYYYYLNGAVKQKWQSAKACTMKTLKTQIKTPDNLRNWKIIYRILSIFKYRPILSKEILIENAGWHFSYLGGIDAIKLKIASISHFENDTSKTNSDKALKEKIKKGEFFYQENKQDKVKYVKIDNSFPKEIIKNRKKYSKFIN
jgi:beta-1,4-mannosyl-glycoprotein beta-1,4-N-acetylglucosaminyltransferase